jgi:hypothetical protein
MEKCELCGIPITPAHRHLLEMETYKLACACDPCALRFQNVQKGHFKLIPRDVRALVDFNLSDATWENLALPINLAFFFFSTPDSKIIALYPSPAGATESLLSLKAWEGIVKDNPILEEMEPDVEALLVNRVCGRVDGQSATNLTASAPGSNRAGNPEYYLAPVDVCFELVGLIRMHWKGFSGGQEVWDQLDGFFARVRSQCIQVAARPGVNQGNHHA